MKPKPETRNPNLETRNPKPETRNPKPETRNPKPNPNRETQYLEQVEVFRLSKKLYEKGFKLKPFWYEVYYTACSLLVILKKMCSKLHCQKGLF